MQNEVELTPLHKEIFGPFVLGVAEAKALSIRRPVKPPCKGRWRLIRVRIHAANFDPKLSIRQLAELGKLRLDENTGHWQRFNWVHAYFRLESGDVTRTGIAKVNAAKKRCVRGHLLEGNNVRLTKQGHRICRQCAAATARASRSRVRQRKALRKAKAATLAAREQLPTALSSEADVRRKCT